jgi:hypothetical protein
MKVARQAMIGRAPSTPVRLVTRKGKISPVDFHLSKWPSNRRQQVKGWHLSVADVQRDAE